MTPDHNSSNKNINELPDDLTEIWNKTGEITYDPVVSQAETDQALQGIWDSVEKPKSLEHTPFIIKAIIAAAVILFAAITTLFTYQVNYESGPGEISVHTLNDGSTITLNAATSLSHNLLFGITHRTVKLNGHAQFDVVSDADLPFSVQSPNFITTVLGTVFEVDDWMQAKINIPQVKVIEGRVQVNTTEDEKFLTAGETTRLISESTMLTESTRTNTENVIWSNNRMQFNDVRLDVFLERLSIQSGVGITLNASDESLRISANYSIDKPLADILSDLAALNGLNIQKTHNGYMLSK